MVRAKNRSYHCRSNQVIQKGYCWRRIRALPVGRRALYAVIKMRRFYCQDCEILCLSEICLNKAGPSLKCIARSTIDLSPYLPLLIVSCFPLLILFIFKTKK